MTMIQRAGVTTTEDSTNTVVMHRDNLIKSSLPSSDEDQDCVSLSDDDSSTTDLKNNGNNNIKSSSFDSSRRSTKSTVYSTTQSPHHQDYENGDGSTSGGGGAAGNDEAAKFVKKESRHVFYLRVLVLVILFAASAAISLVVYFVTKSGESESFQGEYYAAADKVVEAFLGIVQNRLEAQGSLIVAMTAHGIDHGKSWPFVTLSSFQERAATIMDSSGVLFVGFTPIVPHQHREAWENYTTASPEAQWYPSARQYQKLIGIDDWDNRPQVKTDDPNLILDTGVANYIYDYERDLDKKAFISPESDWYLPVWLSSPVTQRSIVNQNQRPIFPAVEECIKYDEIVFDGMHYSSPGYGSDEDPGTAEIAWLLRLAERENVEYKGDIFTNVFLPVHDSFNPRDRKVVGVMRVVLHWARYFTDLLPESTGGVVFVLDNHCDEAYTYRIDGAHVIPLGHGDLHDTEYDNYMQIASFSEIDTVADGSTEPMRLRFDKCQYTIRVYPSDYMVNLYRSSTPVTITLSVAFVFAFAVFMFYVYDRLVENRQRILMDKAKRTHQIVASLFPKNIRDQILNDQGELHQGGLIGAKNTLKSFVRGGMDDNQVFGQMPIADLYPEATVMFADISGFTSWSSCREPTQVFILLQALYGAFDEIAKKRRVFKVETIGDSYVAVAGVPEPDPAHAVKMARFAWDCLAKMKELTQDLERQLGPGTGDLTMRFGLNSGPVTAGLLRGDRARFQLFGDTVNTASRMESTGIKGKIQCSQSTADQLERSGKQRWIEARKDLISAKGKGILQTYFLTTHAERANSAGGDSERDTDDTELSGGSDNLAKTLLKREREVEWVSEVLRDAIRDVVSFRESRKSKFSKSRDHPPSTPRSSSRKSIPIDEFVDVIKMPKAETRSPENEVFAKIPADVSRLVREYVSVIAAAYPGNPFHNFEHACHVLLCTSKFLKRIVSPTMLADNTKDSKKMASIDPLTSFAVLFAAFIHDTNHPGVSNDQLAREDPRLAERYQRKSIAEQNALDVAWDVLMNPRFREMRDYIFETDDEFTRFRQVVVNMVLATDIFDPELTALRKARWFKAFSETSSNSYYMTDARATVVIERIMQASDVCHTMQHWHVYMRFNKKLFEELLLAYRRGRCTSDPAQFWYEGEIKFFDNYVIPLAQNLKDCNAFGVSSDECLNFALRNRAEWENRGKLIVEEYVQEFTEKYSQMGSNSIHSPSRGGTEI